MLVPNCFAAEIDYLTLFLLGEDCRRTSAAPSPGCQHLKLSLLSSLPVVLHTEQSHVCTIVDNNQEDITSVMFKVFDYIEVLH
jgi:hypothetical protein